MDASGNRKHRRFLVDDCAVEVAQKSLFTKGEHYPVLSLSAKGMQYVSFEPVKDGQRLNMALRVGDAFDFMKALGVVRWSQQIAEEDAYRVGVELTKLSGDEAQKLRDLRRTYWPRQQQILDSAAHDLKVPEPLAKKLAALLIEGHRRSRPEAQAEAANTGGPWLDGDRPAPQPSAPASPAPEPKPDAPASEAKAEDPDEAKLPKEKNDARDVGDGMKVVPAIKLYWLGGKYRTRLGKRGRPVGSMAKMWLPGIDQKHFACRLADNSMTTRVGKSFNHGDVVVFSMDERAKPGTYAFIGTKDRCCYFRRFHKTEDGEIVLSPGNPAHKEIRLTRKDIKVMWPAVACLQSVN